jgi:hypothetical protein
MRKIWNRIIIYLQRATFNKGMHMTLKRFGALKHVIPDRYKVEGAILS